MSLFSRKPKQYRKAKDVRDHDLVKFMGRELMITWTVGLRNIGEIRIGYVPADGGREEWMDFVQDFEFEYLGRA